MSQLSTSVRRQTAIGAICLATFVCGQPAASAINDDQFAPPNRIGPALSVPANELAESLTCTANVVGADTAPVLLLSGTGNNSDDNFGWNWKPALNRAGIPWCASDIQDEGAGNDNYADMQIRGEYITYAIRTMYHFAQRKISILGHSQGGSVMRWSLRFWPDTRRMVDDVIGLAPPNHGTEYTSLYCSSSCKPALWQLGPDSNYTTALNSYQETFAGISYTTIRTDQDMIVTPGSSSELSGPGLIANLRIQDLCPDRVTDHVALGTIDPVAEAYAMDALHHRGPADLTRIDPAVCTRDFMSGVNRATVAADLAAAVAAGTEAALVNPAVSEEPALRCYTRATGCRGTATRP